MTSLWAGTRITPARPADLWNCPPAPAVGLFYAVPATTAIRSVGCPQGLPAHGPDMTIPLSVPLGSIEPLRRSSHGCTETANSRCDLPRQGDAFFPPTVAIARFGLGAGLSIWRVAECFHAQRMNPISRTAAPFPAIVRACPLRPPECE
jgi:hypothetical protein